MILVSEPQCSLKNAVNYSPFIVLTHFRESIVKGDSLIHNGHQAVLALFILFLEPTAQFGPVDEIRNGDPSLILIKQLSKPSSSKYRKLLRLGKEDNKHTHLRVLLCSEDPEKRLLESTSPSKPTNISTLPALPGMSLSSQWHPIYT